MSQWQEDWDATDRKQWEREQANFTKQEKRAERRRARQAARQPRSFPEPHVGERTSYVYFIQAEDGGPVKIGWTFNAEKRLRAFQSASPYKLVIRKVVKGTQRLEHYLHHRYEANRLEGEWFDPQPDMPGCLCVDGISSADWLDSPSKIRAYEEEAWTQREDERLQRTRKEQPPNPVLDATIDRLKRA